MQPRPVSPAATADEKAEHQQQEPDRAAPPPPPPPQKDIYTTLAGTLTHPMDAQLYYQCVHRELPADHTTLQGWRQEKGADNEWGRRTTFSGKTPGKAPWTPPWKRQPRPSPARPGTPRTDSTPSLHSTAGNTATLSPSTPSTTIRTDGRLKTTPRRHHHTPTPREPNGVPSHLEKSRIATPRLPHPPRSLRYHQRRTTRSKSPTTTGR